MRSYFVLPSLALAMGISSAQALPVNLDIVEDFNVFVEGNYSARFSDAEGRIAAGNNVTLQGYSVNSNFTGQPALVVGNNLNFSNGQINGTATGNGNVEVGGTSSFSGAGFGTLSNTVSVNFSSAFNYLDSLSLDFSARAATGTVSNDGFGELTYSGDGVNGSASIQTFNLSALDFQNASRFNVINVDADDTLIFNIAGSSHTFKSAGSYAGGNANQNALQSRAQNILYNFYEATSLTLNNGIWGSILTPQAAISCAGGQINGQVIASSWNCGSGSQTEAHYLSFASPEAASAEAPVSPVPSPRSLGLMFFGLCALALARFRVNS